MRQANIIGILIILLSSLAYASPDIIVDKYSNSFSLTPYTLETQSCACGTFSDQYIIENTGSYRATIDVNNNKNIPQNFYSVTLNPGQKVLLEVSADISCNAEELSYTLYAGNEYGTSRSFARSQDVIECQNLGLSTSETSAISPGQSKTITLELINPSSFNETYLVYAKDLKEYLRNTTYRIELPAYTIQNVSFKYEFPAELYGNYSLEFEARTEKTKLKAELTVPLEILRDYDFELSGDSQEICVETNNKFSISIENKGAVTNTYYTAILGATGYDILQREVTIDAGDSAQIEIQPKKNKLTEEEIQVRVKTRYGDNEASIYLPVSVKDCFDLTINTPNNIISCGEESTDYISFNNSGIKDLEVEIKYNNSAFDIQDSVYIEAGEEETTSIERTEAYTGSLELEFLSGAGSTKRNIQVESKEYCSQVIPQTYEFSTTNIMPSIKIPVKNDGVESDTYEISSSDGEITQEISLEAGETKDIYLNLDFTGLEFNKYVFTIDFEGDNDFAYDIVVNYKEKSFAQKIIDFMWNNPCTYAIFTTWLLALILCVVWIFAPAKGKGNPNAIAKLIALLVIIALVLILVVQGEPKSLHPELGSEPDELYFETYSDETFELYLPDYFRDLDQDNLSFELEGKVKHDIKDDILRISDEPGVYTFTLKAMDREEEVESPDLILKIIEKQKYGFAHIVVTYCLWFAWLGLIIMGIFAYLAAKKIAKPGRKPKIEYPEHKTTKKTAKKSSKRAKKKKTAKKAEK